MKLTRSILLPVFCVFSLVCSSKLLQASTNAQPWGEQEAERDAQEEITSEEKSAQEEMSSSIYGRITSIDQDMQVLSLLPTDQLEDREEEDEDEDTPQDYHFRSDTPVTGRGTLSELSPGDYVTLDYYTFRNRNRITEVSFDRHEENEEKESRASGTTGNSSEILVG